MSSTEEPPSHSMASLPCGACASGRARTHARGWRGGQSRKYSCRTQRAAPRDDKEPRASSRRPARTRRTRSRVAGARRRAPGPGGARCRPPPQRILHRRASAARTPACTSQRRAPALGAADEDLHRRFLSLVSCAGFFTCHELVFFSFLTNSGYQEPKPSCRKKEEVVRSAGGRTLWVGRGLGCVCVCVCVYVCVRCWCDRALSGEPRQGCGWEGAWGCVAVAGPRGCSQRRRTSGGVETAGGAGGSEGGGRQPCVAACSARVRVASVGARATGVVVPSMAKSERIFSVCHHITSSYHITSSHHHITSSCMAKSEPSFVCVKESVCDRV